MGTYKCKCGHDNHDHNKHCTKCGLSRNQQPPKKLSGFAITMIVLFFLSCLVFGLMYIDVVNDQYYQKHLRDDYVVPMKQASIQDHGETAEVPTPVITGYLMPGGDLEIWGGEVYGFDSQSDAYQICVAGCYSATAPAVAVTRRLNQDRSELHQGWRWLTFNTKVTILSEDNGITCAVVDSGKYKGRTMYFDSNTVQKDG